MIRHLSRYPVALLLAGLVAGPLLLAGCGPKDTSVNPVSPAVLEPVSGSQVQRVVLDPLALRRLALRTAPVGTLGGRSTAPITAVVYDPDGRSWVYVPDGVRGYLRHAVTILRYDGDTAVLSRGPAAGTPVVVVAAAELLGTEYGVGEE